MISSLFLDTNILLRSVTTPSPEHQSIQAVLSQATQNNVTLWVSRQVLREFLANMTRPQTFTYTMPIKELIEATHLFERRFKVADENASVTNNLLDLLARVPTGGKQGHDANIVATMQTYGIQNLLTLNFADFNRFSNSIVVWSIEDVLRQLTEESGNDGK